MTMTAPSISQQSEWPIYLLADYQNSGFLLELCRRLVFSSSSSTTTASPTTSLVNATSRRQKGCSSSSCKTAGSGAAAIVVATNHLTVTPGYHTEESSTTTNSTGKLLKDEIDRKPIKLKVANNNNNNNHNETSGLLWWHLIEIGRDKQQQKDVLAADTATAANSVDSYQVQVLQLCTELHRAVSPYLTTAHLTPPTLANGPPSKSWRLRGSRSLQPPEQLWVIDGNNNSNYNNHNNKIMNNHFLGNYSRRNSVVEERLSPATIRRLSWRRQVQAKGGCGGGGQQPATNVVSPQRPLVPKGQTFSLASNSSGASKEAKGEELDGGKNIGEVKTTTTVLEKWIHESSELSCRLLQNRHRARWSKQSQKRGKYGESLVHLLIVNQTNEHLILLIILIHLWPKLVSDVFESLKFKGVGCLHLAIAYENERLLKYLLQVATTSDNGQLQQIVEQRVTGSLFRSPTTTSGQTSAISTQRHQKEANSGVAARSAPFRWLARWFRRRDRVSICYDNQSDHFTASAAAVSTTNTVSYWCDIMDHWPTANGHAHLLLFDRALFVNQVHNQQHNLPEVSRTTTIYLGETPLSWSVSFGARSMYELLVGLGGANQDAQDADGNTCLHQLVINNQTGWTRFLVKMGADGQVKNHVGLTSFLLACHLGCYQLFNEFLELSAVEFWSYSMIRCSGYPLTSLDSIIVQDGDVDERQAECRSAVSVILESRVSDNEQKSQLLSSTVVKKLLQEKWHIFARRLFYHELLLALGHLFLMTIAISLRPMLDQQQQSHEAPLFSLPTTAAAFNESSGWKQQTNRVMSLIKLDRQTLIRHLSELATVSLSSVQLTRFIDEWRRYGNVRLQWTYNPLLPNFVASNALIVLCSLVRLVACFTLATTSNYPIELARTEDILLIFAAPLLWSSLLFFIAAFRVTGPFVAMIRYMIVRDLRQFSVIYLVFLNSFAQCLFFINYWPSATTTTATTDNSKLNNNGTENPDAFLAHLVTSYVELWMDLFKMTLGVYDLQPYRHSSLARFFFLLFIYLIPILFNMLIAMMNNTYSLIISQSERAWSFQWARCLFALERRLSQKKKSTYLRLYSINMPAAKPKLATTTANNNTSIQVDETNLIQMDESGAGGTAPLKPKDGDQKHQQVAAKEKVDGDSAACSKFVPALMIIKRMDYTRAERRRLVLGYWQKSIRTIMGEISKRHASATC